MHLDVGCGGIPKGDVNCDLFIGESPHTSLFIHKPKNFVQCDAGYLPFRNSIFTLVYSSHLLEHLTNPFLATKEMKRVSQKVVYMKIPNTATLFRQRKTHLYGWDKNTFEHFLRQFFPTVNIYYTSNEATGRIVGQIWILKRILTFLTKKLLPSELTAICEKF